MRLLCASLLDELSLVRFARTPTSEGNRAGCRCVSGIWFNCPHACKTGFFQAASIVYRCCNQVLREASQCSPLLLMRGEAEKALKLKCSEGKPTSFFLFFFGGGLAKRKTHPRGFGTIFPTRCQKPRVVFEAEQFQSCECAGRMRWGTPSKYQIFEPKTPGRREAKSEGGEEAAEHHIASEAGRPCGIVLSKGHA